VCVRFHETPPIHPAETVVSRVRGLRISSGYPTFWVEYFSFSARLRTPAVRRSYVAADYHHHQPRKHPGPHQ
jgi:hypothetical protein